MWAGPTHRLFACVHSRINASRHRLGLGAKFLSHAQATALSPAERKLQAGIKGAAGKRSAADMQKRGGPKEVGRAKPSDDASGSSSDEEESRTSTFKWAHLTAHSTSHEPCASPPPGLPGVHRAPCVVCRRKPSRTMVRQAPPSAPAAPRPEVSGHKSPAPGAARDVSGSGGGPHQRPPTSAVAAAAKPPLDVGHPPSKTHKKGR